MSKSVIVVDDHTLFSHSLKSLINSLHDFRVLEMFKNGKELVNYFENNNRRPDLILLDIRMPVMNGIDTMQWLQTNRPDQKVLALTMEHEEETMMKMLKLGCRGYLLKEIEPDEFRFALEEVLQNGYYLNNEVTEMMNPASENRSHLTDREIEFLHHVCTEKTYKEIAGDMNLSPKTIDGYREQLFAKLNVKSRTGVVLYAIKNRIVNI